MKCLICNVSLKDGYICPKCGTDHSLYVKIQEAANAYYNRGLAKARARDLSGAAECLRTSLQLNKRSVPVRNLLGLVYYEMGDADLALKEWRLSRLLKFRNNPAEHYIRDLLEDTDEVNSYNNSIQKFNLALQTIQEDGNLDMGIIQLKKVINLNPRLLKAYQVLALVYIQTQQYAKAVAVLNRCLEVDRGNICARAYLNDLKIRRLVENKKVPLKAGEKERADVIIPTKVRDVGSYLLNAFYILVGVALALGIFWYAIVPQIRSEYESVNHYTADAYEGKIADLNQEVADLTDQLEELNGTIGDMQRSAEDAESTYQRHASDSEQELVNYDRMLEVMSLYITHDYLDIEDAFAEVSRRASSAEAYRDAYKVVQDNLSTDFTTDLLVWANYYRDTQDYATALAYYNAILEHGEDPNALYWAGMCHVYMGDPTLAAQCFESIGENFVETDFFEMAMEQLGAIRGTNPDVLKAQYRQQWQERQNNPENEEENTP